MHEIEQRQPQGGQGQQAARDEQEARKKLQEEGQRAALAKAELEKQQAARQASDQQQ